MYFYKSQSGAGGSSHEYWWAHLWLSSAVFAQCQCQPFQNPSSSSSANWSPLSTLITLITLTTFITLMNLITIAMPWWPSSHGIILSTSPYMQWATLEPPEVPPTAIQGPILRCHSRSLGTNFLIKIVKFMWFIDPCDQNAQYMYAILSNLTLGHHSTRKRKGRGLRQAPAKMADEFLACTYVILFCVILIQHGRDNGRGRGRYQDKDKDQDKVYVILWGITQHGNPYPTRIR